MGCCNVLSPQEERIIYHKLANPRQRTNELLKGFRDQKPRIDPQRAVLFTEAMKENEQYPLNLRWAKAFKHICENIDVVIQDHELIVGTCGGPGRYSILYPELRGGWYEKGLKDTQKKDAYEISDETIDILLEKVGPYWKGRTSQEMYLAIMDPETRDIIYGDDDYGSTGMIQDNSNVSSTLNWPGNYDYVMEHGMSPLREEAQKRLNEIMTNTISEDYDKIPFLQAEIEVCDGMETLAKRYADKAREMAAAEQDPTRKAELEQIAKNCDWVPMHAPRTFWEAVQCQWFIQMGYKLEQQNAGGIGSGRIDQYLYPTYKKDKEAGLLDDDKALELLDCLWMKIASNVIFNATNAGNFWEGYAHFEVVMVGGQTPHGQDATNELTYLVIRSKRELPIPYPDLAVRLHSGSPTKLLRACAELVKDGAGFPKFFNDEEIVPCMLQNGCTIEEARNYSSAGCTEIRVPERDCYMPLGGHVNLAAALEMAMSDGWVHFGGKYYEKKTDVPFAPEDIKSFDDLMANVKAAVDFYYKHFTKRQIAMELTDPQRLAAPFMSMLHPVARKAMMDIHQRNIPGGVYHDTGNATFNGFGTVAESLAAIKKVVFDDKKIDFMTLKDALAKDFEGYEVIQQLLLNAPKYGNNDPYADGVARDLDAAILEVSQHYTTTIGVQKVKYVPITAHVGMGHKTIATANGRHAGVALSEGISPTQGSDVEGPIATLTSIRNAMSREYSNTASRLLNMKLSPQAVAGEKGTQNLVQLLRTWVDLKLWHIQIAVVNRETLLAAQKNPEDYKNLIVRVAGYSAYFTELSPGLQTEIINRTEHEMAM